jgi:polyferredoxin
MLSTRQKVRKVLLLVAVLVFPVTLYYFSPYLILMGGFGGVLTGSAILFSLQLLSALLLGRAFCGWVCPAGAIQEWVSGVNPRSAQTRLRNSIKYVIWVPWLATIVMAFSKAGDIHSVDPTYMTQAGVSVTDSAGYFMYAFVTALFLLGALIFGRRAMCHSICWMAPFMILGTKLHNALHLPGLHLESKPEACVSCQLCNRKCTMGLDVQQMVLTNHMAHDECILCGECVDACHKEAIRYAFVYSPRQGVGQK